MAIINNLPLEMVQVIVDAICPRCNQRSRRSMRDVHTIVDLARTSKLFNQLATPHLYHRPPLHKWPLLARTLIDRPDLARHVKQLLVPQQTPERACDFWEDRLWMKCGFPPQLVAYLDCQVNRLGFEDDLHPDYISILASLCPNLEKLEFQDEEKMGGPYFPFCRPNSLQNLKKVNMSPPPYDECLGNGSGQSLSDYKALLRAAPNIQRLAVPNLVGSCGLEVLTLENLTHLDILQSALTAEDLGKLLTMCPNLEILEYECGFASFLQLGYNISEYQAARRQQFTPLDARDAILKYAKKLRVFIFSVKLMYEDEEQVIWREEKMYGPLREAMERRGIEFKLLEDDEME